MIVINGQLGLLIAATDRATTLLLLEQLLVFLNGHLVFASKNTSSIVLL
jgi:hypothetical protein